MNQGSEAVTVYKWRVPNLKTAFGQPVPVDLWCFEAMNTISIASSDSFALKNGSSALFNLGISFHEQWIHLEGIEENLPPNASFHAFVQMARVSNKMPLTLNVKFWIEDSGGRKFGEEMVRTHRFETKTGRECTFLLEEEKESGSSVRYAYDSDSDVVFCCALAPVGFIEPDSPDVHCVSLCQRLWSACEEGTGSDLIIQAGEKSFNVHRIVFTLQSPVFHAMLSNKNFIENQAGIVPIEDIEVPVLEALIRWMYTGEAENPCAVVDGLYKAADKYQIDELKKYCVVFIMQTMNAQNTMLRLIMSILSNNSILCDTILSYIAYKKPLDHFSLFQSKTWIDFKIGHPDLAEKVSKEFHKKIE